MDYSVMPERLRTYRETKFVKDHPPLRPPHFPWRTLLAAITLFSVGTVFLLMGLGKFFSVGLEESVPFLVIGSICFIPGSYHSFIFLQIFRGIPGYSYDQIPSYDE